MNLELLIQQLSNISSEFQVMQRRSKYDDLSDLPESEIQAIVTRAVAAIIRISGQESAYVNEAKRIMKQFPLLHQHLALVMGVVYALYSDIKAGYLQSLVELVHAEAFADFLDMAQHLLDTGYKDAAGVIAGSALESHLRLLCAKSGIATEIVRPDGSAAPKKADAMNADLVRANAYSKLDQKGVTAWLDLRNKAAHGEYEEYRPEQVTLMIAGVRNFLIRIPA
ncbi:hypothetical protein U2261_24340 [Achromobacter xylosoxidans]|uniref:hypothetical protein n=1 Tax=Alcaligenes xylosoxydans xylosoxydans TaxID=85698 RepID=UPI001F1420A7|nr:hypothetical protein [Achromobacter xylosoxidans]MDZ5617765.1 hypothetical protein [Achromobacter xylosoxidans]MDZ5626784.1 hypothetical protein [Achromobacter xylosoxidans]MDZ5686989.1 hypothetical protein [Achromobacter xylosoxidans]